MFTTLNKIRYLQPCIPSWEKLLSFLGKVEPDDEHLLISTILESNGIRDAVWCIRTETIKGKEKEMKLFAADCAESLLHIFENEYPKDTRPRNAIEITRKYINGLRNKEELCDAALEAYRCYFEVPKFYDIAYCAYAAAYYDTPFYCVASAIESNADLQLLKSFLLKYI